MRNHKVSNTMINLGKMLEILRFSVNVTGSSSYRNAKIFLWSGSPLGN